MKCPNCKKRLKFVDDAPVVHNSDIYDNINREKTSCCGVYVTVIPRRHFELIVSCDQTSKGDWGN